MNMKRMRGRNHRPNGGGGGGGGFRNQQNGIPLNRNHVFDSSGPEMRVRGTAQQLFEKYQQLARDASSNGDRVLGEAYYQHAEHYFRIISAINQAQGQPNSQPNPQSGQPNGQPYQNNNGQDRGAYQNGGQNGHQNGDYNRRTEPNAGDVSTEPQTETRHENRYEPRNQENRSENRGENRQHEPRRYENRPYENRDNRNKPDYQPRQDRDQRSDQRPDRQDRDQRFRPETPIPDTRIDISSALEAELAAATAGLPAGSEPAGGELPAPAPEPTVEARAIPIIPDAPPPARNEALPAAEDAPVRAPRARGRPRTPKPEAAELKLETPDTDAE